MKLLSLQNYPRIPEITEDGQTFLENALKKAQTVATLSGEVALADDSGLTVDALGGAPGVYSARYSGPGATDAGNIARLLQDLKEVPPGKRSAAFICVCVLWYPDGQYFTFAGRWQGEITDAPAGTNGFGYDPVFFVPEQGLTAAQLPPEVKNRLSHRAQALAMLKNALARGQVPAHR